jgi:hypothetical protein
MNCTESTVGFESFQRNLDNLEGYAITSHPNGLMERMRRCRCGLVWIIEKSLLYFCFYVYWY